MCFGLLHQPRGQLEAVGRRKLFDWTREHDHGSVVGVTAGVVEPDLQEKFLLDFFLWWFEVRVDDMLEPAFVAISAGSVFCEEATHVLGWLAVSLLGVTFWLFSLEKRIRGNRVTKIHTFFLKRRLDFGLGLNLPAIYELYHNHYRVNDVIVFALSLTHRFAWVSVTGGML